MNQLKDKKKEPCGKEAVQKAFGVEAGANSTTEPEGAWKGMSCLVAGHAVAVSGRVLHLENVSEP